MAIQLLMLWHQKDGDNLLPLSKLFHIEIFTMFSREFQITFASQDMVTFDTPAGAENQSREMIRDMLCHSGQNMAKTSTGD